MTPDSTAVLANHQANLAYELDSYSRGTFVESSTGRAAIKLAFTAPQIVETSYIRRNRFLGLAYLNLLTTCVHKMA